MTLTPGRSRTSYLVFARNNAHLFVWSPLTKATSTGFTFRYRKRNIWYHHRIIIFQRNPERRNRKPHRSALLRKTLTLFEYSTWTTRSGVGVADRIGAKGYIRLKIAPRAREKDLSSL